MRKAFLSAVLILSTASVLAACQAAPSPTSTKTQPTSTSPPPTATKTRLPSSTPTQTSSPTLEPTETKTPTATPDHPVFTLYTTSGNTILKGAVGNDFKGDYTDPGAVVFHDGLFHMYYNNLHGYPPKSVGIGYAVSEDGLNWERVSEESILNIEELPFEAQSFNVTDVIVNSEGAWMLYVQTRDEYGGKVPGRIGVATSPSAKGPWTFYPEPVLIPDEGAWDSFSIHRSCVIETEDSFHMYYIGYDQGMTNPYIGLATSPDGIHFSKYNNPNTTNEKFVLSDPIITPETFFLNEKIQFRYPNVFQTEDGWILFYRTTESSTSSMSEIHFATSEDGIHWKKGSYDPMLTFKDIGSFSIIWVSTIEKVGDTYYLYMELAKGAITYVNVATFSGNLIEQE